MRHRGRCPSPPGPPSGASRVLKFGAVFPKTLLTTPRLRLLPVLGDHRIGQAFELLQPTDMKAGLNLPQDLTLKEFRRKLVDGEPFATFLLQEKATGSLVGLLGAWAVAPQRGWAQVLYGISPEFRGRGFAREGAEALLVSLFKSELLKGVGAIVVGPNPKSRALLDRLGMKFILQLEDRRFFGLSREQFENLSAAATHSLEGVRPCRRLGVLEKFACTHLAQFLVRLSKINLDSLAGRMTAAACTSLLQLMLGSEAILDLPTLQQWADLT